MLCFAGRALRALRALLGVLCSALYLSNIHQQRALSVIHQQLGNDVLAGENQPPPAKKKKASTLMNFSAISGRKFLLALLKTFNLMVVPPYAATGRKVAARDEV